ncbi:MAG: NAD-dependent epimerase/dehydratase family protein [Lewinellaceae bacterium]|nr:NAD-dependent epimerase/dehydratase family protein [Saprospiraceae bacterium]MCB9330138.1 NAD-dependent epimerase/dehydratase family protein [Lewinellaceae bacterium]
MRVLITGADGLLGSNLVRLLLSRGHQVRVFLHPSSCSKTLDGLKIQKYYGDILVPDSLTEAMKRVDAVVHAAANTSIWPSRSEFVRKVNIQGTQNVIDAVLKFKLRTMIYIGSASSVNGPKELGTHYAYAGEKYGLDYLDSKYQALQLVLDSVKTRNLPALAILPTYMIGPYDSLPGSGKMIREFARGKLRFFTGGGKNFVHVQDVSIAIANSLEQPHYGKCYVVGNENLSYKAFFKKMAKVVGAPEPYMQLPGWLVKTIGLLGEAAGKVLHIKPMISYPIACISCDLQFVSSDEAKKDLKIPHTPVEQAIRDCYTWFRANGYC